MHFAASPKGHHILAYNSSRIYVINVQGSGIDVKREFKILRRPVSACITDDATFLAVLSSEMQVDLYDLKTTPPQRMQSLILDNSPRTIAISSCGSVLAAAYEGGIEVSSLSPSALPTERRAVKCDAVDALAFSLDGTQILGTTVHSTPPTTVVLTAPYYDPGGAALDDSLSAMWTTSILFPNTSRDCSHAIYLPDGDQREPEWTFTYDRSFETFRAVRLDDLRNGTTYFPGPIPTATQQSKLLPCTLPATTYHGELVSAGFQGKDIWIYGVPNDLDAAPESSSASNDASSSSSGLGRHNSVQSTLSRRTSTRGQDGDGERVVPPWQILCDKLRNNLVAGCKVTEFADVSNVKWVSDFGDSWFQERLVITASGVVGPRLVTDEEDIDFVDGGRVALLDFDYAATDGATDEITLEVGTNNAEPLEEERRDLETEVAIVRRRTVAQRRGGSSALLRAATTAAGRTALPTAQGATAASRLSRIDNLEEDDDDPLIPRRIGQMPQKPLPTAANTGHTDEEGEDDFPSIEEQEAMMDLPYAHSSPRPVTTLRRAATAAAVSRQRHPRTADGRPIEYRRADGRREHPHESDADNWVPPPPPYQKDDPGDLPAFLRGPAVAPLDSPQPMLSPSEELNNSLTLALQQSSQLGRQGTQYRRAHNRTASDSTDFSRLRAEDIPRPRSSPSVHSVQNEDIYDISPQASPRMSLSRAQPQSPTSSSRLSESMVEQRHGGTAADVQHAQATSPLSPSSSGGMSSRPGVPTLELQIPTSPSSNGMSATDGSPYVRRLSNAQTWPRRPVGAPPGARYLEGQGHPHTAPASNVTANDLAISSLPPAPSSNQLASLNKRISQGSPRRLSSHVLNPQVWIDRDRRSMTEPMDQQQQNRPWMSPVRHVGSSSAHENSLSIPDSDQPLIISTPTGVTGAFDDPNRRVSTLPSSHPQSQILAPIPRHPRTNNRSSRGQTVERLENIYADRPTTQAAAALPPHLRGPPNTMPMWVRTPSNSSRRSANSISRRRSRVAQKNNGKKVQFSTKAWKPKGKKKAGKDNAGGMPDSEGWADEPTSSRPKDKDSQCVLM